MSCITKDEYYGFNHVFSVVSNRISALLSPPNKHAKHLNRLAFSPRAILAAHIEPVLIKLVKLSSRGELLYCH